MNGAMGADKVEATNLTGAGVGAGRSCSQYPASSRAGKVLQVLVVLRQMDTTPDFCHLPLLQACCALLRPETTPSALRSPGHTDPVGQKPQEFRKSSPWAGLHVPVAELCAGKGLLAKDGCILHTHHGMSFCWKTLTPDTKPPSWCPCSQYGNQANASFQIHASTPWAGPWSGFKDVLGSFGSVAFNLASKEMLKVTRVHPGWSSEMC